MEFPLLYFRVISQSFCDSRGSAVFANRKKRRGKGKENHLVSYIFTASEEDSREWGLRLPPLPPPPQADTCLPRSVAVSEPMEV